MLPDTVLKTSTYFPFCIDDHASGKNTTAVDTAQTFIEKTQAKEKSHFAHIKSPKSRTKMVSLMFSQRPC